MLSLIHSWHFIYCCYYAARVKKILKIARTWKETFAVFTVQSSEKLLLKKISIEKVFIFSLETKVQKFECMLKIHKYSLAYAHISFVLKKSHFALKNTFQNHLFFLIYWFCSGAFVFLCYLISITQGINHVENYF